MESGERESWEGNEIEDRESDKVGEGDWRGRGKGRRKEGYSE